MDDTLPLNSSGIVAIFEERWEDDIDKALSNASNVTKDKVDPDSANKVGRSERQPTGCDHLAGEKLVTPFGEFGWHCLVAARRPTRRRLRSPGSRTRPPSERKSRSPSRSRGSGLRWGQCTGMSQLGGRPEAMAPPRTVEHPSVKQRRKRERKQGSRLEYTQAAEQPLPTGEVNIELVFTAGAPKPATGREVTLLVNGEPVASGRMEHTVPGRFSGYPGMDIGRDNGLVVDQTYADKAPFAFTGEIKQVLRRRS